MLKLCDRRDLALMCIMYDFRQKGMYEKKTNHMTRAADGYTFELTVPHIGVYAKSPCYPGANMWNSLPVDTQNLNNKSQFKCEMRNRLKH